MSYIEREKVQEILKKHSVGTWRGIPCYPEEIKSAAKDVDELPAADVAPVRHGQWIQVICHVEFEDGFVDRIYECCSACHSPNGRKQTNYCPSCGALMDGGKDDG